MRDYALLVLNESMTAVPYRLGDYMLLYNYITQVLLEFFSYHFVQTTVRWVA